MPYCTYKAFLVLLQASLVITKYKLCSRSNLPGKEYFDPCTQQSIYCLVNVRNKDEDVYIHLSHIANSCEKGFEDTITPITANADQLCYEPSLIEHVYVEKGNIDCEKLWARPNLTNPGQGCFTTSATVPNKPKKVTLSNNGDEQVIEVHDQDGLLDYDSVEIDIRTEDHQAHLIKCPISNIALHKPTKQSGPTDNLYPAKAAVNGRIGIECDFSRPRKSQVVEKTWWSVDLLKIFAVRRVKIYLHPTMNAYQVRINLYYTQASDQVAGISSIESWDVAPFTIGESLMEIKDFHPFLATRQFAMLTGYSTAALSLQEFMVFGRATLKVRNGSFVLHCPLSQRFHSELRIFAEFTLQGRSGQNAGPFYINAALNSTGKTTLQGFDFTPQSTEDSLETNIENVIFTTGLVVTITATLSLLTASFVILHRQKAAKKKKTKTLSKRFSERSRPCSCRKSCSTKKIAPHPTLPYIAERANSPDCQSVAS